MAQATTFTFDGKTYEIKFTIASIEKFENAHGPIMIVAARPGGILSVRETIDMMAASLYNDKGNRMGSDQGTKIAEGYMQEIGLLPVQQMLGEALERDCGFLTKKTEGDTVG